MNMPDNIKNWWGNLLDRERYMLTAGGVVLGILVVYSLVWSPLSTAVDDYKMQINTQQKLLRYLHHASTTIAQLKSEGIQAISGGGGNLLSVAEQTLSQQELSTYLKQVQQPQQNQVALTFENISFDKLMQWLQMMVTQHGVSVKQMTATRLSEIGAADVQITLSVNK